MREFDYFIIERKNTTNNIMIYAILRGVHKHNPTSG